MTEFKESNDDSFSFLFEDARNKLDEIDKEANDKKSDIVIRLARDLEDKIPIETISSTILKKLKGHVGKSLIHECLPAKYKQEYRRKNAQKQKKKLKVSSLAPLSALNQQYNQKIEAEDMKQKHKVVVMAGSDGSSHIQSDEDEESIENEIENHVDYTSKDNIFIQSVSSSQQQQQQPLEQNILIEEGANNIGNESKDASYIDLVYSTSEDSEQSLEEEQQQLNLHSDKIAKIPRGASIQIPDNDADILHFKFFKTFNVLQGRLNELLSKVGQYGQVCFKGDINRKSGKVLYCEIEEPNQHNLTEKSVRNDIATTYKTADLENKT